jgi:hypothetical protein
MALSSRCCSVIAADAVNLFEACTALSFLVSLAMKCRFRCGGARIVPSGQDLLLSKFLRVLLKKQP